MKLLSIVFSFRNEAGNIEPLVKRISTTMQKIENWKYEKLNETERIAHIIKNKLEN